MADGESVVILMWIEYIIGLGGWLIVIVFRQGLRLGSYLPGMVQEDGDIVILRLM